MPELPSPKKLPPWAWILAIGGGLLVGYFVLRRTSGAGVTGDGTQDSVGGFTLPITGGSSGGGGMIGALGIGSRPGAEAPPPPTPITVPGSGAGGAIQPIFDPITFEEVEAGRPIDLAFSKGSAATAGPTVSAATSTTLDTVEPYNVDKTETAVEDIAPPPPSAAFTSVGPVASSFTPPPLSTITAIASNVSPILAVTTPQPVPQYIKPSMGRYGGVLSAD